LFHCAVVSDLSTNPLPPPHPELLKYFDTPKRVLKRAKQAIEECQQVFKVKEGALAVVVHQIKSILLMEFFVFLQPRPR